MAEAKKDPDFQELLEYSKLHIKEVTEAYKQGRADALREVREMMPEESEHPYHKAGWNAYQSELLTKLDALSE